MVPEVRCSLVRVISLKYPHFENGNTSTDHKLSDRLPSIHSDSPAVANSSTAQVDD
jgi:hypothetical protein